MYASTIISTYRCTDRQMYGNRYAPTDIATYVHRYVSPLVRCNVPTSQRTNVRTLVHTHVWLLGRWAGYMYAPT